MTIGSRGWFLEELATVERGKRESIFFVVSGVLGGGIKLSGIGIKDSFPETERVTRIC
jgi:hypothetical protein